MLSDDDMISVDSTTSHLVIGHGALDRDPTAGQGQADLGGRSDKVTLNDVLQVVMKISRGAEIGFTWSILEALLVSV